MSGLPTVIIGGGHNGLTAAAYLAGAGQDVLVLERSSRIGGATVSQQVFPGQDARLSRYSYLVSLLPQQIVDDLGLNIRLARRRYSSYTPRPGTDSGLLIDNGDEVATRASFAAIGAAGDHAGFSELYERTASLAAAIWPSMTQPLPTRTQLRARLGDDSIWSDFIDTPLGSVIERQVRDDLVRGVVLTDGLISTFASADQADLQQNICFLYHVIGGGTGAWDVPVGGMGQVSGALETAARRAGARIITDAEVTALTPDGLVTYRVGDLEHQVQAETVLCAAAPQVLSELLGEQPHTHAEGAQVEVNLLLSQLPRLRESGLESAAAFGGTFHVNESYTQLDSAYHCAVGGAVPDPIPLEIYCHSLTDPSILGGSLRESGAQTMTVFALQVPHRLMDAARRDEQRSQLQDAVLASLSSVLGQDIDEVVLTDSAGQPCVETRTTADLEDSLAMPGGNIFHGPLSFPFAGDEEELATPAQRWGVATAHPRILLCGAGSRRGGGVSGLGGYHAARALLED
ncbi:phytoene desaturase family protein [Dermacoccaceae bacterium W4C1]